MRAQKSVCINIYTYINYSVGSIVLIIKVRNSSTSSMTVLMITWPPALDSSPLPNSFRSFQCS